MLQGPRQVHTHYGRYRPILPRPDASATTPASAIPFASSTPPPLPSDGLDVPVLASLGTLEPSAAPPSALASSPSLLSCRPDAYGPRGPQTQTLRPYNATTATVRRHVAQLFCGNYLAGGGDFAQAQSFWLPVVMQRDTTALMAELKRLRVEPRLPGEQEMASFHVGRLEALAGNWEQASASLLPLVELPGLGILARLTLSGAAAHEGDFELAVAQLLQLPPSFTALAELPAPNSSLQQQLCQLQRAVWQQMPEDIAHATSFAAHLHESDQVHEASRVLASTMQRTKQQHGETLRLFGGVQFSFGNFESACSWLQQSYVLAPQRADTLFALAGASLKAKGAGFAAHWYTELVQKEGPTLRAAQLGVTILEAKGLTEQANLMRASLLRLQKAEEAKLLGKAERFARANKPESALHLFGKLAQMSDTFLRESQHHPHFFRPPIAVTPPPPTTADPLDWLWA